MCTINQDHIMYGSWDIKPKGQSFLSFWSIFSALNLLATPEIKILKKKNITWRYYHFTLMYQQWRSYDVSFLRYQVQQTKCFVILGHVLPFEPPNNPRNQWSTVNENHMAYDSWDIDDIERDRQTFFSFWTIFALLLPPPLHNSSKNEKVKKMKA